jgi:hypothetical protein
VNLSVRTFEMVSYTAFARRVKAQGLMQLLSLDLGDLRLLS